LVAASALVGAVSSAAHPTAAVAVASANAACPRRSR
jgi:hypothetical protein